MPKVLDLKCSFSGYTTGGRVRRTLARLTYLHLLMVILVVGDDPSQEKPEARKLRTLIQDLFVHLGKKIIFY